MRVTVYLSESEIDALKSGKTVFVNASYPLCSFYIRKDDKNDAPAEQSVGFLLTNIANVGDIVVFSENGYCVGMTYIDADGRSINNLDRELLRRTVKHYAYRKQDWSLKEVLNIDI